MPDTLVLDARALPIDVIAWPRTMLHLETAKTKRHIRVVSEYEDRMVKTAVRDFPLPAVLQLVPGQLDDGSWTDRVVRRSKSIRFNRRNIFMRDRGICQYCGDTVSLRTMQQEHVTPRAQGGLTCWENIVTSCLTCNQKKGGRTPEQAGMKLLSTPKKPSTSGLYFFGYFEEGMPEQWRPWLPEAPPTARDRQASRIYWNSRLR